MDALAHELDLQCLNQQVAEISVVAPGRQIAIFTHHCLTLLPEASDARHRGSPVSSGFATGLSGERWWADPAVVFWAFGHTHFSCNFRKGGAGKTIYASHKGSAHSQGDGLDGDGTVLVGRTKGFSMLDV